MVSMDGTLMAILAALFIVGCFCYLGGTLEEKGVALTFGVGCLLAGSFLFGNYYGRGAPLAVGTIGSSADLSIGHYYETLIRVPNDPQKMENKDGVFVIKDGGSNALLLIKTNYPDLPPRFMVVKAGGVISVLPVSAPTAPSIGTP